MTSTEATRDENSPVVEVAEVVITEVDSSLTDKLKNLKVDDNITNISENEEDGGNQIDAAENEDDISNEEDEEDCIDNFVESRNNAIDDDKSDEMILFVGDFARGLTENDLLEAFKSHGCERIASVDVKRDKLTGRNLGYGFVQMSSHKDALDAKRIMHEKEILGRKIRIGWAQRNTSLFVGDLDETVTTDLLRETFGKYGPIVDDQTYVKNCRIGFVRFLHRKHAEAARKDLNGFVLGRSPIRVVWHHGGGGHGGGYSFGSGGHRDHHHHNHHNHHHMGNPHNHIVSGQPLQPRQFSVHVQFEFDEGVDVNESTIQELFASYGEVQGVTIPKSGTSFVAAAPNLTESKDECGEDGASATEGGEKLGGDQATVKGDNSSSSNNTNNQNSSSNGRRRGYGFVHFTGSNAGKRHAMEAIRALQGQVVQGIKLQCNLSNNTKKKQHGSHHNPSMMLEQKANTLASGNLKFSGSQNNAKQSANTALPVGANNIMQEGGVALGMNMNMNMNEGDGRYNGRPYNGNRGANNYNAQRGYTQHYNHHYHHQQGANNGGAPMNQQHMWPGAGGYGGGYGMNGAYMPYNVYVGHNVPYQHSHHYNRNFNPIYGNGVHVFDYPYPVKNVAVPAPAAPAATSSSSGEGAGIPALTPVPVAGGVQVGVVPGGQVGVTLEGEASYDYYNGANSNGYYPTPHESVDLQQQAHHYYQHMNYNPNYRNNNPNPRGGGGSGSRKGGQSNKVFINKNINSNPNISGSEPGASEKAGYVLNSENNTHEKLSESKNVNSEVPRTTEGTVALKEVTDMGHSQPNPMQEIS